MAEYRFILDAAYHGRWREIERIAGDAWQRVNLETPGLWTRHHEHREDPRVGIYDIYFDPAWIVRQGLDPRAVRDGIGCAPISRLQRCGPALSRRWMTRVAEVAEGGMRTPVVELRVYRNDRLVDLLTTEARVFLSEEWCPDWLLPELQGADPPPLFRWAAGAVAYRHAGPSDDGLAL